jgi:hypothetical protein
MYLLELGRREHGPGIALITLDLIRNAQFLQQP